ARRALVPRAPRRLAPRRRQPHPDAGAGPVPAGGRRREEPPHALLRRRRRAHGSRPEAGRAVGCVPAGYAELHAGLFVVPAAPVGRRAGRLLRAGARGGRRHGGDDRARRRDQPLDPRRDRAALAPGCTLGPAPLPDPRLRGIPPDPRAPTVTTTVPTGGERNAPRR